MERRNLPLPIPLILAGFISLILLAALASDSAGCTRPRQSSHDYEPGQLLVIPSPGLGVATIQSVAGYQVLDRVPALDLVVVGVPVGQEQAVMEAIRQDPTVSSVELNGLAWSAARRVEVAQVGRATPDPAGSMRVQAVADDPAFDMQWNLPRIQIPPGWETTTGSPVVIAMLGTGVDPEHPDLQGKQVTGANFVNEDEPPVDDNGLGTFEAGIAAAATNNQQGIAGTSWGARIMPVKVLGSDGTGSYSTIIAGILFAVEHGANVICMPFAGTEFSVGMQLAVDQALSHGVVVIASAGDERESGNPVVYPAGLSGVIGVTGSNQSDGQLPTAGYGSSINFVDLTAPGAGIVSTWSHDHVHEYGAATGANLGAPHVAGVAALVLSVNPTLAPVQVIDILQRTATDLGPRGPDRYFGWGLVNAVEALSATPHFLQISPDRLIFRDDGQTISPPVVQIINNTTGPGTWTARVVGDAAGWLELSSPAGSTPSYVTVSARRPSSQVCVRTGFIIVDSLMPEAVNSPRVIDVVLRSSSVCRTYYSPAVANGGEVK